MPQSSYSFQYTVTATFMSLLLLLFLISSKGSFICTIPETGEHQTFHEALAGTKNSSLDPPEGIDPMTCWSTTELHLALSTRQIPVGSTQYAHSNHTNCLKQLYVQGNKEDY